MSKNKPGEVIHKTWTRDEMLLAVSRLQQVERHLLLRSDDDNPLQVFADCIDELLSLRELKAFVAGFNQQLTVKLARKIG